MSDLGNKQILSDNLRNLMSIHGIDRNKLCSDLNLKYSTVSEWLSAKKYPRIDKIELLAKYFNVKKSDIIESSPRPEPEMDLDIVNKKVHIIPVFESVSAGLGSFAQEYAVDYIPLVLDNDYDAPVTVCIRVSGDSMYPKIEDGDLIQVRKQSSIDSGSVGVFFIDNEESVVKKVIYEPGCDWLELHSFNPEYMTRRFDGQEVERVRVFGLVQRVIKEL